MRYRPDQKAKSRRYILNQAGAELKKCGYGGIGVDGLAAAAGVTSGAFYSNFEGKEGFLEDVINEFLGEPFLSQDAGNAEAVRRQLKDFVKIYLDVGHCSDPRNGCVIPTLSADVSRAGAGVRNTYQIRMIGLIDKMAKAMTGPLAQKRKKAWTMASLMIGAVTVGRALPRGEHADAVIKAALDSALGILES